MEKERLEIIESRLEGIEMYCQESSLEIATLKLVIAEISAALSEINLQDAPIEKLELAVNLLEERKEGIQKRVQEAIGEALARAPEKSEEIH